MRVTWWRHRRGSAPMFIIPSHASYRHCKTRSRTSPPPSKLVTSQAGKLAIPTQRGSSALPYLFRRKLLADTPLLPKPRLKPESVRWRSLCPGPSPRPELFPMDPLGADLFDIVCHSTSECAALPIGHVYAKLMGAGVRQSSSNAAIRGVVCRSISERLAPRSFDSCRLLE